MADYPGSLRTFIDPSTKTGQPLSSEHVAAHTELASELAAVQADLLTAGVRAGRYLGINAQTGTTYTLVLADEGKLVTLTNAAAITLTVPTNATSAFPVGSRVDLVPLGAGMVTIVGAGGVTIRATPSAVTRATYSAVSLVKIATDEWLCVGDLA